MTLVQIPKLTTTLEDFLKNLESIEPLFDALSSVVFFIKNIEARYVFVNQTLVNRCGLKDKSALIGKTSEEVFPHSLGKIYTSQDLQVIRRGKKLT
ncbi:PAS domain-containing protein, partial [Citrobacter freundii]